MQAATKLANAAEVMADHPAALQLRLLQTVVEVAAERNSTLVLSIPGRAPSLPGKGHASRTDGGRLGREDRAAHCVARRAGRAGARKCDRPAYPRPGCFEGRA
jgi:hypothetical protein